MADLTHQLKSSSAFLGVAAGPLSVPGRAPPRPPATSGAAPPAAPPTPMTPPRMPLVARTTPPRTPPALRRCGGALECFGCFTSWKICANAPRWRHVEISQWSEYACCEQQISFETSSHADWDCHLYCRSMLRLGTTSLVTRRLRRRPRRTRHTRQVAAQHDLPLSRARCCLPCCT